ncbi:hypothetical protein CDAR_605801 [Caerostris darwini]|uniref:Uncharacterized protein n=1 Tax=Caerostris darwini TaxID=1538125 RepID=A0AAV4U9W7_9ARAC|nr:hypothetical protein CDAR_605801 [Caerostris darwini]
MLTSASIARTGISYRIADDRKNSIRGVFSSEGVPEECRPCLPRENIFSSYLAHHVIVRKVSSVFCPPFPQPFSNLCSSEKMKKTPRKFTARYSIPSRK